LRTPGKVGLRTGHGKEPGKEGEGPALQQIKRPEDGLMAARGATTPARLRRVIESIGKNLMGLAAEEGGLGLGWDLASPIGLAQGDSRLSRLDPDCALLECPARFVLAEHILRQVRAWVEDG
jgi:hypothetical protein